jgi:STE24 endopeptidase
MNRENLQEESPPSPEQTSPPTAEEVLTASPEARRYQRQRLLAAGITLGLSLLVLALLALRVGPRLRRPLNDYLGDHPGLQVLLVAAGCALVLEIITLPIHFWSSYLLEHRYGLSTLSLYGWWKQQLKRYLVSGLLGLVLVLGLYTLMWWGGAYWWLWAALGWLFVALVLGRLVPTWILPFFYRVTPLQEPALEERFRRLLEGTGLSLSGIYRLHLSEETRKANAALAGLGRSRRILLGDTLLEQFQPEEIEVVLAHEIGHHVYRHLQKWLLWGAVHALVGFWLVDLLLRRLAPTLGYERFDEPAAFPLVVLLLALLGLVLRPLHQALSRHFERQCDRYALARTGLREAYRSAFLKLAHLNKVDPDPHPLVVWFFYDHPPIRERLALAETAGR